MLRTEEVSVQLGVDNSSISKGLLTAKQKFANFGSSLVSSFKSMGATMGASFGAAMAIAGMRRILQHFDEIKDMADNLQISTDFLQGLQQLGREDVVGGAKTINKALGQLSVNLGQAREGTKIAVEKFTKLGLSLGEIATLDAEQMFYRISEQISKMPDATKRLSAAFDLLGKSGKEMNILLSQGPEALRKSIEGASKLTKDEIAQLGAAQQEIESFQNTLVVLAGTGLARLFKAYERFDLHRRVGLFRYAEEVDKILDYEYEAREEAEGQKKLAEGLLAVTRERVDAEGRAAALMERQKESAKAHLAAVKAASAEVKKIHDSETLINAEVNKRIALITKVNAILHPETKEKELLSPRTVALAKEYERILRQLFVTKQQAAGYENEFTRSNLELLQARKMRLAAQLGISVREDQRIGIGDKFQLSTSNLIASILSKVDSQDGFRVAVRNTVNVKVEDSE